MTNNYSDIIHLPHHRSSKHPQMSLHNRAAQFMPFAALTGYKDALSEIERLTERELVLDEDEKALLDWKLQKIGPGSRIRVTYFVSDEKKEGGTYQKLTGIVKRIDPYQLAIIFTEKQKVEISRIIDLEIHDQANENTIVII